MPNGKICYMEIPATDVTPLTALSSNGEAYATFLDPAGNLLGLYQEGRS